MDLHRVLLNMERIRYEQAHGWISRGELLLLAIDHSQFDWLHQLSELVVQIDELLRADEPVSPNDIRELSNYARTLLTPAETGDGFARRYYDALQHDPDVVLTHAAVLELLAAL
jgi:hypothetical protein